MPFRECQKFSTFYGKNHKSKFFISPKIGHKTEIAQNALTKHKNVVY